MPSMVRYEVDELSFELPDGFADESVNILIPTSPTGRNANIVVTREPRTEAPLGQQVVGILTAAGEKVQGLKVLGHREREVGTVPGYEARSHSMTNKVPTYQRQVYLSWYGTLLCFTVSGARAQNAFCDSLIEKLISTLRLKKKA
ncbi:MAG: DcrB-related protein [Myxococcales bacterium]|nr:DcrB-related protein [Myxococcales bacterium]